MLCQYCQENEATVHLTHVVGGDVKKLHLCQDCAQKSGFDPDSSMSIKDVLLGLGASSEEVDEGPEVKQVKSCPSCGLTLAEFKKTGRLGCQDCYSTFRREIVPLLQSMHHSTKHVGKTPAGIHDSIKVEGRIEQLERNLNEAVAKEEFERAAQLRDEIAKLRKDDTVD